MSVAVERRGDRGMTEPSCNLLLVGSFSRTGVRSPRIADLRDRVIRGLWGSSLTGPTFRARFLPPSTIGPIDLLTVSYPHLTLPTISSVHILVDAVSSQTKL